MSSMRYTSLGVMRPPKPPCWRDFVASSPKSISINSDGVDIADLSSRALGARSPVADIIETSKVTASLPGNKPSRLVRRPRANIHRTKSEHVIHAADLPESALTATVTNTFPKGLHVGVLEGPRYVEENNRRCQNWLAGIEAAVPLDEVGYTGNRHSSLPSIDETPPVISGSLNNKNVEHSESEFSQIVKHDQIYIDEQQQEVDVEIPEETFVWDVSKIAGHESPSSDEDMKSTCKDTTTQKQCEKALHMPVSSREVSSTHSHVSVTPSSVSTTRSPNSITRCLVSTTCSPNSSERSPVSATCSPLSPASSSRELTDVVSSLFHEDQYVKCEIINGTCGTAAEMCMEKTHKDTINKLRCDHMKIDSSSEIDNDCCSRVALNGCSKIQLSCSHIQAGEASPKDSRFSFNSIHTGSSSSGLSGTRKLLSDSELWALTLSTCD